MIADKIYCPRLLIISGSGKNTGKTTLVSALIQSMKPYVKIVAIKISPHFHPVNYESYLYHEPGKFTVYEEHSFFPENDSSKMKNSGASQVFYLQAKDPYVGEAFLKCMDYVQESSPVICESGSLNQVILPGLRIYIQDGQSVPQPLSDENTVAIHRDQEHFKSVVDHILYRSGRWEFHKQAL
jgi:hypothetical protein